MRRPREAPRSSYRSQAQTNDMAPLRLSRRGSSAHRWNRLRRGRHRLRLKRRWRRSLLSGLRFVPRTAQIHDLVEQVEPERSAEGYCYHSQNPTQCAQQPDLVRLFGVRISGAVTAPSKQVVKFREWMRLRGVAGL